jgi:hypothetical protein
VARLWVLSLAVILLNACQTPSASDPGRSFYRAPAGTKLILQRDITILPERVKTYFQQGRQVYVPNEYDTFCKLEVLSLQDTEQVVKADEFLIKRSGKIASSVVQYDADALRPRFQLVRAFDQGPQVYGIVMFLDSPRQPNVNKLLCVHMQDPLLGARGPSIEQIRAALGDTFMLILPGDTL